MSKLKLRVSYFQDSTPEDVACREENFIRRQIDMSLPLAATALVLVDVWNAHFIESWIERARKVTLQAIVPALQAAREAGLTVIHAPSPEVASRYPQTESYPLGLDSLTLTDEPSWPPAAFRQRQGDYAAYVHPRLQPPGIKIHESKTMQNLDISPSIEVKDDDIVIATGEQLHNILSEYGILHLIYAGFAANWCVMHRDYGIRAMYSRSYNIVLLRDCTTGVEFPDTLDKEFVTEITIREVEQQYGFSASNKDFISSCREI